MKEIITGLIIFSIIIGIVIFLKGDVIPDLSSDGGYEPCQTGGHPLYQEC